MLSYPNWQRGSAKNRNVVSSSLTESTINSDGRLSIIKGGAWRFAVFEEGVKDRKNSLLNHNERRGSREH